jgi:hypothetical protein
MPLQVDLTALGHRAGETLSVSIGAESSCRRIRAR